MANGNAGAVNKKIDEEGFLDNIKNAFQDLVTLEIITAVGEVELNIKDKKLVATGIKDGENCKTILTKIDLLQGDIQTVYAPEFVTGEYQSLKEFHKNREDQGYKIIQDNIETLKKLFWGAKDIFAGKK